MIHVVMNRSLHDNTHMKKVSVLWATSNTVVLACFLFAALQGAFLFALEIR